MFSQYFRFGESQVFLTKIAKSKSQIKHTDIKYKMGCKSSQPLRDEEMAEIQKETGFSRNQIDRLYSRFNALDVTSSGGLSREDFLRIPELTLNPLGHRIVVAFFRSNPDEERVSFSQFVRVLAPFQPITKGAGGSGVNSRAWKLRFLFKMYDINEDDKITKEELMAILQMMIPDNISDEQLQSIAERTIQEADADGDGMIGFEEFSKILERSLVEEKLSFRFSGLIN